VDFNNALPAASAIVLLKYSYDYPAAATGYPALQGTLALPAVLWLMVAGAT